MSASTSARSTAPSSRSQRAARNAAQRRWRAESGRQRSARVSLVSLGRLFDQLDPRGRRLLMATVGADVMRMALFAAAAQDGRPVACEAEAAS